MNNVKEIPLTQGKVAIVDAQDYDWLMKWKWHADKGGSTFYAVRNIRKPSGKCAREYIHRVLMRPPAGMETDHRNGNGLDNRRDNLRICTRQENQRNCKLSKNNTSGRKGVCWHEGAKKWRARITIGGKLIHLGIYGNINEAIVARRAKEKEAFGEFMRLEGIVG